MGSGIDLNGAVCMYLKKDKAIVEASGEDVKKECEGVLRQVVKRQALNRNGGRAAVGGVTPRVRSSRGNGERSRLPRLRDSG